MWSHRVRAARGFAGAALATGFVGSVLAFAALPRAVDTAQQPVAEHSATQLVSDTLAPLRPNYAAAVAAAIPDSATAVFRAARTLPRRDPVPVVMPIRGASPRGGFGTRGPMWAVAHSGLDFSTGIGTEALAVVSGTVRAVFMHPAYGWVVELQRSDGVEFWYCHLSRTIAEPGQAVAQGQVIGLTGDTGNTSGPHLHFEVRVDAVPTDPADFLFNHPGRPGDAPGWAYAYRQEPPPGHSILGWPPSKEEKEKAAKEKAAKEKAAKEKAAREKAAREKAALEESGRDSPPASEKPTPGPSQTAGSSDDDEPAPTSGPTHSPAPTPPAPTSTSAS